MTPQEYFNEVAEELSAVEAPQNLTEETLREVMEFVWDKFERNIAPAETAAYVIQKFGCGETKES